MFASVLSIRTRTLPAPASFTKKEKSFFPLQDLTATGHIGAFVGMLTDSRSFLSYPRHHYFRRILCNYFGTLIENGEMTSDLNFVGNVIKDISFNNSVKYFKMKQ